MASNMEGWGMVFLTQRLFTLNFCSLVLLLFHGFLAIGANSEQSLDASGKRLKDASVDSQDSRHSSRHGRDQEQRIACRKRALQRRNCDLKLGPYQIALTLDRATIATGVWKRVYPLPQSEKETRWERAELRRLGNHWLMEFEFLTPAQGEIGIQDLIWMVLELKDAGWTQKIQEVVQKRRVTSGANASASQEDPRFKYGLRLEKDGSIHWWSGRSKGVW